MYVRVIRVIILIFLPILYCVCVSVCLCACVSVCLCVCVPVCQVELHEYVKMGRCVYSVKVEGGAVNFLPERDIQNLPNVS